MRKSNELARNRTGHRELHATRTRRTEPVKHQLDNAQGRVSISSARYRTSIPNRGSSVPLLARPFHDGVTLLVAVRARLDEKMAAVSSTISIFLGVLDMSDELRDRDLRA